MNDDMEPLSPEASALLSEVRGADDPSPGDRTRVKKALMATIAGGAGLAASTAASSAAAASGTAGASATTAGISMGMKVAATIFALGALGTTAVVVPQLLEPDEPAVTTADESAPAEPTSAAGAGRSPAAPAQAEAAEPADTGVEADSEATVASADVTSADVTSADTTNAEVAAAEAIEAPPELTPEIATSPRAAVSRGPRPARAGHRATASESAAPPEPAPASTLPQELALLRRAQRAINAEQPEDALRTLAEHASRFPSGVMVEEREAARVVALCDAGRTDEARSLARRFLNERPGSPLAARVRAACP